MNVAKQIDRFLKLIAGDMVSALVKPVNTGLFIDTKTIFASERPGKFHIQRAWQGFGQKMV